MNFMQMYLLVLMEWSVLAYAILMYLVVPRIHLVLMLP